MTPISPRLCLPLCLCRSIGYGSSRLLTFDYRCSPSPFFFFSFFSFFYFGYAKAQESPEGNFAILGDSFKPLRRPCLISTSALARSAALFTFAKQTRRRFDPGRERERFFLQLISRLQDLLSVLFSPQQSFTHKLGSPDSESRGRNLHRLCVSLCGLLFEILFLQSGNSWKIPSWSAT